MYKNSKFTILLPTVIACSLAAGMLLGSFLLRSGADRPARRAALSVAGTDKLNMLLRLIDAQYVDTVRMDSLTEEIIPLILENLDPHSMYFSAKDLGTGTEQHITITSSSNMSKEDIEKAVKDAEQYAAEDAKIKEKVEVRNQADQMVYQSEKTLGEVGDKIPADEKAKVQAGIDKLKEVLKGDDTDAIKSATEELTQMFYQMSEKLYQQANPQGGAQAGPDMGGQNGGAQTGPNGQQYYDADYKVVDDDDNNKK